MAKNNATTSDTPAAIDFNIPDAQEIFDENLREAAIEELDLLSEKRMFKRLRGIRGARQRVEDAAIEETLRELEFHVANLTQAGASFNFLNLAKMLSVAI